LAALDCLKATEDWINDCWLWIYRGAWHEFATYEIEMAVPLSPQEVIGKRNAILNTSRKKTTGFPGRGRPGILGKG
jgi:glucosamine-6-phosphate deaminase